MIKANYTVGPWTAKGTIVYFPQVRGGFDLRRCPDAEANARLCAAAPDLLHAAQAAWICISELKATNVRVEVANALQAAIEKAIGEEE